MHSEYSSKQALIGCLQIRGHLSASQPQLRHVSAQLFAVISIFFDVLSHLQSNSFNPFSQLVEAAWPLRRLGVCLSFLTPTCAR
jgi:hypothetical protein